MGESFILIESGPCVAGPWTLRLPWEASSPPLAGVAGSLLNPASRGPDAPYPRRGNPESPRAVSDGIANELRWHLERHHSESPAMGTYETPDPQGDPPAAPCGGTGGSPQTPRIRNKSCLT